MTPTRRTTRLRRLLAGVAGLALLGGAALVPSVPETDAAWTDAEAGSATFQAAGGLDPPVATQACTARGGLLGLAPVLTVHWRVPESMDGYSIDDENVEFAQVGENGVLLPITNFLLGNEAHEGGPDAYTSAVNFGLLGGLLGGTGTVAVRLVGPDSWTSDWLVADGRFPVLGGSGSCVTRTTPNP